MLRVDKDWLHLAAAWAAFVFIPFNLFAGTLIAKAFTASEAIIGLLLGSTVLCLLTVPSVIYASITGRTYAQAIEIEIGNRLIRTLLKLLVPVVNIGWFSIQTIAATQIVLAPEFNSATAFLSYVGVAVVFIAGPIIGGYAWLYRFGAVAVVAMVLGIIAIIGSGDLREISWGTPDWKSTVSAGLLVLGTWVFSSTTCVMDVARELRRPGAAITAILCGTIAADVSLMVVGFLYPEFTSRLIGETNQHGISAVMGSIFVTAALWSTNDSNFYSTEKALHNLGVAPTLTAVLVVITTGAVGIFVGDRLFSVIGPWLQVMGWIGIPMGLFWLSKCHKVASTLEIKK